MLNEIKRKLSNENIVYLGDTLNFPYGPKDGEAIKEYSVENANFLLSHDVKIIVIACGTATSYALEFLRKKYDIPIIGIIEPTTKYVETSNLKQIRSYRNRGDY